MAGTGLKRIQNAEAAILSPPFLRVTTLVRPRSAYDGREQAELPEQSADITY